MAKAGPPERSPPRLTPLSPVWANRFERGERCHPWTTREFGAKLVIGSICTANSDHDHMRQSDRTIINDRLHTMTASDEEQTNKRRVGLHDDTVRLGLHDAQPVAQFLAARRKLDVNDCLALLDQAICLLEGLYVHLPVKRATYAVDPVRRLQLLKVKLESAAGSPLFDDLAFHRDLIETFTSVRDLHTNYVLPHPFERSIAFVPFQIEECFDKEKRIFVVSNVIKGLPWFAPPPWFRPGIEVTHWNEVPMPRALELVAAQNAGSNPAAYLARGLARLTIRPLAHGLPPDEERVTLRCAEQSDLRVEWRIITLPEGQDTPIDDSRIANAASVSSHRTDASDHESDLIHQLKRPMFAPANTSSLRDRRNTSLKGTVSISRALKVEPDELGNLIQAFKIKVKGRPYGYIRLRSFKYYDGNQLGNTFVDVIANLLEDLPENGLILDIRDNPGGYIQNGEKLLQLLTPKTIQPLPAQFIISPLSVEICGLLEEYRRWGESMHQAGAQYSDGFCVTPPDYCNDKGQKYTGPSVLIINGRCFSTADIFAASYQDHAIGTVLGTDERTGAGGAEVVNHSALCDKIHKATLQQEKKPELGLASLGKGIGDIRIAFRRFLRVGKQAGTPIEDVGVKSDELHFLTKDDVLGSLNHDLIERAADLLAHKPTYTLRLNEKPEVLPGNGIVLDVATRNLDTIQAYVGDKRFLALSNPIKDGSHRLHMPPLPQDGQIAQDDQKRIRLEGLRANTLVAARLVEIF
jgi:hypothetical protein